MMRREDITSAMLVISAGPGLPRVAEDLFPISRNDGRL